MFQRQRIKRYFSYFGCIFWKRETFLNWETQSNFHQNLELKGKYPLHFKVNFKNIHLWVKISDHCLASQFSATVTPLCLGTKSMFQENMKPEQKSIFDLNSKWQKRSREIQIKQIFKFVC